MTHAPGDLSRLMTDAAHLLEKRIDRALADLGVTARQFRALWAILGRPAMSRATLSNVLKVSPQAAGGLAQRLEDAGLIECSCSAPGAPTEHRITLAGIRCIDLATPLVAATERTAVGLVSSDAMAQLQSGLEDLVSGL